MNHLHQPVPSVAIDTKGKLENGPPDFVLPIALNPVLSIVATQQRERKRKILLVVVQRDDVTDRWGVEHSEIQIQHGRFACNGEHVVPTT